MDTPGPGDSPAALTPLGLEGTGRKLAVAACLTRVVTFYRGAQQALDDSAERE